MARKRDFTIRRGSRLVVGIDGQTHVMDTDREGKDGHFTDEGQYRRTIKQVVAENQRQ